ncbi:MAG: MFS transporter [Polyangiaceae bacterium]
MPVLKRITDANIRAVYWAILSLSIAYGLAISVLAKFLEAHHYGKDQTGTLAIWFAGGIVAMSLPSGWLIRRFGGKRVMIGGLLGYAIVAAVFPLAGDSFYGLGVIRALDGAFSVPVWVASETIILARAPRAEKAFYTSLYALSLALGYVIGPAIAFGLVKIGGRDSAFVAAGVVALLAIVQIVFRLEDAATRQAHGPSPDEAAADAAEPATPTGTVFSRIKTSCLATFSYGYFQASVVLFLPTFLTSEKGFTDDQTVIVPAFFAAGMLIFANIAGRAGDRFGNLAVMRALGVIGTLTIVGFIVVNGVVPLFVLVFVAGASLASVSPPSLALQGIVTKERDLTRSGAMYNASYAAGMLAGPPISGYLFQRFSGTVMNAHYAGLWAFFVLFTIVFRRDDPRARGVQLAAKEPA